MIARLVLIAWATTAAGFDARHHRLPNWLTLGGLLGGGLYALASGTSLLGGNAANAWLAAAIAFLVLLPAYLGGWMGAGDVKLFAAMGMLGGGKVLLPTLVIGSLVAGIGALVFIMLRKKLAPVDVPVKRPLPFGVGLALGFALSVLDIFPVLAWKG
jgi:prepilin peptidase CpaA